jgi:hypothetical protein
LKVIWKFGGFVSELFFLKLINFYLENIETEQNSIKGVNKNLDQLRLQLEKLNKYIYNESDTKANLSKSNVLIENDFVLELKVCRILW